MQNNGFSFIPDLEVARGGAFAFHQGNCCFHILDSVAVVDSDNDAFAAQQSVFVQLLELTNAVEKGKHSLV